jgi:hypothetical protein
MTHDDFLSLIKQPDLVTTEQLLDLKDMVELFPYFAPSRLFYAKALQKSNSVMFGSNLKFSSIYTSNRRWLYYYIHPEKKVSTELYKRDKTNKSNGNYFDMINAVESDGGDAKQSLKNLAERLRSARSLVAGDAVSIANANVDPKKTEIAEEIPRKIDLVEENRVQELDSSVSFPSNGADYSEVNARNLIKERKYTEAIEILRVLNLNNPKKSVYFADQIRFLEKVIANSKK